VRIAMVCPYSLARPGGVQGQAVGLARALRGRGHQVTVLAPDDDHPVGEIGRAGGDGDPGAEGRHHGRVSGPAATVVVGRSVGVRANGSVAPVTLSPAAARRTRRYVARHGFDVVHLHEPLAPVVGYDCLRAPGPPLVGTFHRSGASPWYGLLGPLARRALAHLEVRCAVSEAARRTAEPLGGEYEVLFNGVDVERFSRAVPAATEGPTILFVGRHEERKGLAVLLEATRSLPDGATLWIGGEGPVTAELRGRFPPAPHRRWLGPLSESEVASRMAGADVLCAPSLGGESFGVVLLEGMAARCVVVASDLDGYRAAARGCAVLVPPGDTEALARTLVASLSEADAAAGHSSPASLDAAAAHARAWSLGRLAERYEVVYGRAVASWGARRSR
jgi:phosphatidylinositol alpha-mannosyltransferase